MTRVVSATLLLSLFLLPHAAAPYSFMYQLPNGKVYEAAPQ